LVKAVEQDGGRRVFELTDAGRDEAKASAPTPPWDEVAGGVGDELTSIRDLLKQVAAATWQLAHMGSSRQLAAARDILRDTRRRLFQLLAEDPEDR